MSVVDPAGLDKVRASLTDWLRQKLPDQEQVEIVSMNLPEEGGSSTTIVLVARMRQKQTDVEFHGVLRLEATSHNIYHKPSTERQYEVMKRLRADGKVPTPRVCWYEADESLLGARFFLMEYVDGSVPSTFYHQKGFFTALQKDELGAIWRSAIEAMAAIHLSPVEPFLFLERSTPGVTLIDRELSYWDEFVAWCQTGLHPIQAETRRWLEKNRPIHQEPILAWGDARIGNMIFRDGSCAAVIDWETASLLGAESDLAWWNFFDWYVSDAIGVERLEGFGGRDETLSLWEKSTGRTLKSMHWHEVFATWRYSVIRARARYLRCRGNNLKDTGAKYDDPDLIRMLNLTSGCWV